MDLPKSSAFSIELDAELSEEDPLRRFSGSRMPRVRPLLPIREHFSEPELLGPVWTLTRGQRTAACQVWSHQFGFELRLLVSGDDLPRTQVVCFQEDLIWSSQDSVDRR
jgi:hypothetical protein